MIRRLARSHRALPALACLLALGCGGDAAYRVSGKVTFQGKDVPAGKIYFIPDATKGATGPAGFADIKDGKYDTSSGGRGAPAGPVIITVEGLDPSSRPDKEKSEDVTAKVLFPSYELAFDMPKESTTKNIEVPADAAKGPKQANKKVEVIP